MGYHGLKSTIFFRQTREDCAFYFNPVCFAGLISIGGDLNSDQTHSNPFFDQPILNSPYIMPTRHWELDAEGQPTQKIIGTRRRADFITPIPKPKKRKNNAGQEQLVFDEGKGLSTTQQQYDPTSIIK